MHFSNWRTGRLAFRSFMFIEKFIVVAGLGDGEVDWFSFLYGSGVKVGAVLGHCSCGLLGDWLGGDCWGNVDVVRLGCSVVGDVGLVGVVGDVGDLYTLYGYCCDWEFG
jgi:hypothetical protein